MNARNFPLIVIHDPLDSFKAGDYIKKPESFNQMARWLSNFKNQILTSKSRFIDLTAELNCFVLISHSAEFCSLLKGVTRLSFFCRQNVRTVFPKLMTKKGGMVRACIFKVDLKM